MARAASSLAISVSMDSRLTLPGTDLINASADGSAPLASSSSAAAARAARRVLVSGPSRTVTRAVSACSAWCRAERMIRSQRPADGGSICPARHRASSSSRTRSARRSAWQMLAASHSVSLPASSVVHSRNPRCRRICARWYSIVLPDHS
jgi:hypothetical protein